jgi:hypothetical protein
MHLEKTAAVPVVLSPILHVPISWWSNFNYILRWHLAEHSPNISLPVILNKLKIIWGILNSLPHVIP